MHLPQDTDLSRFVGGQIEVQNQEEGYLYRGEIKAIRVEGEGDDTKLTVELNWMAKAEGFPPERWVISDSKPYQASLLIYSVSDIGDDRLCLYSPIIGEMTVLFPKGGSTLERSKVEDPPQD